MSARQVTVQLRPDIADELRRGAVGAPAREIADVVSSHGSSVRPVVPGAAAGDPLGTTFVVDAEDEAHAQRIREDLAALDGVVAAYVKPPEALP
jgi:hypothetical protein